ncbi:MAG: hypothetical protein ACRDAM_06870 [Casimicrobium sp.]
MKSTHQTFVCKSFAWLAALPIAALGFAGSVQAQQSFTATVDGKAWESDNDGINVMPVALGTSRGTVTITATSKGFSGYPTPKGFPDSFSIVCPMPKKPERMTTARSSSEVCRVSFTKAARSMMSPDYAKTKNEGEFVTKGDAGDKGYVNFTKVSGKNIEGEFLVELTEQATKKTMAVSGKFRGIDQQVGSKGFN